MKTLPKHYNEMYCLVSRLPNLAPLLFLDLDGCGIDACVAEVLSEHITKMSALKKVCLGMNPLGDLGILALDNCFYKLPKLQGLEFVEISEDHRPTLSFDAVEEMSTMLAFCTGLVQLDLGHNALDDDDKFLNIMLSLQHLTMLAGLKLEHNEVTTQGVWLPYPFLEPPKNLQLLSMDEKNMTTDSADALIPLWLMLTSLTALHISVDVLVYASFSCVCHP